MHSFFMENAALNSYDLKVYQHDQLKPHNVVSIHEFVPKM